MAPGERATRPVQAQPAARAARAARAKVQVRTRTDVRAGARFSQPREARRMVKGKRETPEKPAIHPVSDTGNRKETPAEQARGAHPTTCLSGNPRMSPLNLWRFNPAHAPCGTAPRLSSPAQAQLNVESFPRRGERKATNHMTRRMSVATRRTGEKPSRQPTAQSANPRIETRGKPHGRRTRARPKLRRRAAAAMHRRGAVIRQRSRRPKKPDSP